MNSSRVLQLATSTGGGAGIAARRLHEALTEIHVDSTLITLTGGNKPSDIFEVKRSVYDKIKSSMLTALQSILLQSTDQLLTPLSKNSIKEKKINLNNYDVVHIHAFYNLLSTSRIIKLCKENPKKRFFITLHDERFLTGGCHYSQGCANIKNACRSCPQATRIGKYLVNRDYKKKDKTLNSLQNLSLISPSAWLQTAANNNPATADLKCHMVRNPIPQAFFEVPVSQERQEKLRVVFISAHLNTRMKGLTTLVSAMNLIADQGFSDRFELLLVGRGQVPNFLDSRIKFGKTVTNTDEETAKILSECQILAVPSIQDNLPSTMVEAICAGLSVVGTKIGGIEEILSSYGQSIVNVGDSKELASELLYLLKVRSSPSRNKAISEFSYPEVAKRLVHIYETG
jgi:glycosyltransferase involved in cell wall biosynthesis